MRELPVLGSLKELVDPLLSWLPIWLHSLLWAILVLLLCFALLLVTVRYVLPWLAEHLREPLGVAVEGAAALLLLPEYLATLVLRRRRVTIPNAVYTYDEAIIGLARAGRWISERTLATLGRSNKLPRPAVAMLLVVLALLWNFSYCNGLGKSCRMPVSQWYGQVQTAMAPERSAKPKPCPTKKGSKKKGRCASADD